jgi:hypothetical protein
MRRPSRLKFDDFSSTALLGDLVPTNQVKYLQRYLADMSVRSVLIEDQYFDRDYLSEFSAFYSQNARGYPNICKRIHFFSGTSGIVDRGTLKRAAAGNLRAREKLQAAYLGFAVIRPLPAAQLGRTVLRWYEDIKTPPRTTDPGRTYECHIAGVTLRVDNALAWQQQDAGVGKCATVAVWSMLQSSAFDDRHGIPTTASITEIANRVSSEGYRIYPSGGLAVRQICDVIIDCKLAPTVVTDGVRMGSFGRAAFSTACASLIRSGYPVLISGTHWSADGTSTGHTICATGFREATSRPTKAGCIALSDEMIRYFYIHDDNLGPNVRCVLRSNSEKGAYLVPCAPRPIDLQNNLPNPTRKSGVFYPDTLIAAVHDELRMSPQRLNELGHAQAVALQTALVNTGLEVSTRFSIVSKYLGRDLERTLARGPLISRVRMALCEQIAPMSLFVGVVRIGSSAVTLTDTLFDTSELDHQPRAFVTVVYDQRLWGVVTQLAQIEPERFGIPVKGF